MPFVLLFTIFIAFYILAYFLGRRYRHLIPIGKKFEVGLACGIVIMIISMTENFWFTSSDKNNLYFTIGFGLSSGLTSSLIGYDRKANKDPL